MNPSIIFDKQFTNKVEMILHSPCNIPGKTFEMTMVLDKNLSKDTVIEIVPHLLKVLKRHSEVFLNVRLNLLYWQDDENMENRIVPMAMAMISSNYEEYESNVTKKNYLALMQKLKLFHARSKLIIVVTDGQYEVGNEAELKKVMQPFLYRKVMNVVVSDTLEIR